MSNRNDLSEVVRVRRGDVLVLVAAARWANNRRIEAGGARSKPLEACFARMELLLPVQAPVPAEGGADGLAD